jgi:pseudoazurin
MSIFTRVLTATLLMGGLLASIDVANAAEHEVKMRNMGAGGMMVFEPPISKIAPGDTVHFLATDKGHDVESIEGMLPEGAAPMAGKLNQDLTVTFDKPGIYGYRCKPHYAMGMVGLIVVGSPTNEDAAKAIQHPGKAKQNFVKLFEKLDTKSAAAAE